MVENQITWHYGSVFYKYSDNNFSNSIDTITKKSSLPFSNALLLCYDCSEVFSKYIQEIIIGYNRIKCL